MFGGTTKQNTQWLIQYYLIIRFFKYRSSFCCNDYSRGSYHFLAGAITATHIYRRFRIALNHSSLLATTKTIKIKLIEILIARLNVQAEITARFLSVQDMCWQSKDSINSISQNVSQLMNLRRHSLTERTSPRRTAICRLWLTVSKIKSYVIFHLGGLVATRSNLSQCTLWSENSTTKIELEKGMFRSD